ncbi:PBP1A family penicillin-binding protein [Stakelama sp. CBK3Z-3]|uniref:PBP1A family penicillin-binding protein n=1 Tax=Stakelama flava TaxID=2860338 RepID=A0ABS6XLG5_9SPHN|nr:PBP1A family penicillin-binding protein [Stakelama flava]MBW4331055.1 PBP1A family penicillin-binding protein [Stakelama flava]
MRYDPPDTDDRDTDDPLDLIGGMPPPDDDGYYEGEPPRRGFRWWRWLWRGVALCIVLIVIAIGWLAFTAPLSKSLEPLAPPSITLLAADGTPIAERGAIIGKPVDAAKLPEKVTGAFLAIEDRRFYSHWGIDPRGILRAAIHNSFTDGSTQGGSTITQQLAKNAFLDADRTLGRKVREVLISFWLEAWLSKDEILSRYLSNVYFGDNVYGLTAAAQHYFSRDPADLTTAQAAMIAGLVKAPSALDPTNNLKGARARQAVVVHAMQEAGYLTSAQADAVRPAKLKVRKTRQLPSGTYFADWILPQARDRAETDGGDRTVRTTLEMPVQKAAEAAVRRAGLNKAQVAVVVMRPDGRVVAMVGGRNYAKSPFNRAVQARRQPGSTFKLFVYLAALRSGMSPDSTVLDEPVTIGKWSPENADGEYKGPITLTEAFARSSNVAAARLTNEVGPRKVIRAARDLGLTGDIPDEASIALGTSSVSLLELTSAFAAVAAGEMPVEPRGLAPDPDSGTSWLDRLNPQQRPFGRRELQGLRTLMAASVDHGTSRHAALSIPAYGKTGTTQDNRDGWFIGYAGGLVTGVWLGNDDNSPNPGLAGGGLPARIWRDVMTHALDVDLAPKPQSAPEPADDLPPVDNMTLPDMPVQIDGQIGGIGLQLQIDPDGGVRIGRGQDRNPAPPRAPDTAAPPPARDEDQ